ncbi:MAG: phage portal protein, partial [Syntrophorhabdaceae bacterium]|nr:phage portal protein [Syntrophorhabdaceae bacterium]
KSVASVYGAVAWAFRCTNLRMWGVSNVPYIIVKRGAKEDIAEGIDFPLFNKNLLSRSEAAICLWGANYVLKNANAASMVKQLQWLNPTSMKVLRSEQGITGFEQRAGTLTKKFTPEQMVYAPLFNPSDDLGPGVSPMQVALEAAGLAASSNSWAARFFEHGAIPAVILSTESPVPDPEIERIRNAWDKLTGGVKNAWRTIVLRNGLKPTIIGMPVKDLAMPELYQQVRSQIACAFEIPETMLSDSANYATSAEHRRSFWLETIIPKAQWHAERFNEQLFWPMGLEMRLQPEQMEAVQKDEAEKSASAKAMIDAAVAVFNAKLCDEGEARAAISVAYENMSLPAPAENWTPPEPVIPEPLQPFAGQPGTSAQATPAGQAPLPEPAGAPQGKSMLADLERWQRKCEKAGKARPFESENIPADVHERIDALLAVAQGDDEIKAVFAPFTGAKQLRFIPRGASEPIPQVPNEVAIEDHDIDMALAEWDKTFPEFAGLLDASVKGGGEALTDAGA